MITACEQQPPSSHQGESEALSQSKTTDHKNNRIADSTVTEDRQNQHQSDSDESAAVENHSTLDSTASDDELVASIGFAEAEIPTKLNATPDTVYRPICNVLASGEANNSALNNGDISAFCDKMSNRLASVSKELCLAARLIPSGCNSINGVPLMVRNFPPLQGKRPLGKVLVIGGTHGDELTSVSVTFRWIEKLNKHHSGLFHWHIIPAMNPDGLLKRSATRTNNNGVDLNRNMPSDDWEHNALKYWEIKGNKDPRKYPGEHPNSEPESHWLVDEINLFNPDAIIAVHAPYGVVDFDSLKLNTAPRSLGKLHLNLLGTYPGSLGNYAGINLDIPVITLELPHSWVMPSEQESDRIWQDIVSWLKKNLNNNQSVAAE